ncbi:DUF7108 domain-containing protein [Halorubellus salinus]|uniref:DUF7108 domain-containing protein n=1 Tax=Halorubellus salinus TaxID=755309 RepID=UPI001D09146E|nr:rnhA operon protein [Halorubellus salinus]
MPEDANPVRDGHEEGAADDAPREDPTTAASAGELPGRVVDHADRLTRLAREAVDEDEAAAYRTDREETLAEHGFTARVREDDAGETLVLHPEEWLDDGTIRPDRIEDTDRAVEVSLSGASDPDEWQDVDDHNRALVESVRENHGEVHGTNATVLADFAGNHYAKPIEDLTATELREFETEYVPRNAWLDDDQSTVLRESVRYAFDVAKERVPDW